MRLKPGPAVAVEVPLHQHEDGGRRRDRVPDEDVESRRDGAEGEGVVALDDYPRLRLLRRVVQVCDLEAGLRDLVEPEPEGLDVGRDDLLVIGAAAGEADGDEVLEVVRGHPAERGYGPDDDHVGRAGVARGARELVDGKADGVAIRLELEVLGVVDEHAAITELADVVLVGLAVEDDEYVEGIPIMENRLGGDPGLGPRGATLDLRGIGGIRLYVVPHTCCRLGEPLGCRDLTLSALAGEPDDEIRTHLATSLRGDPVAGSPSCMDRREVRGGPGDSSAETGRSMHYAAGLLAWRP